MQKTKDKLLAKALLENIETVYLLADKLKDFELLVQHGESHLKQISAFYSCDTFEAILLAVMIYKHVQEKSITNRSLATIIGIPFAEMAEMVQTIKKLGRKDFIRTIKDREHGVKYSLQTKILLHTYSGKMIDETKDEEDKTFAFISAIRVLSIQRLNKQVVTFELMQSMEEELENVATFPFIQWIKKHQLKTKDLLFFMNACYEYIMEDAEVDVDFILNVIFDDPYEKYLYRKELANGTNPLFLNNLICRPTEQLNSVSNIILSEESVEQLLINQLEKKHVKVTSDFLEMIEPENIIYENLLYNSKENKSVNIIKNSLKNVSYNKVLVRLHQNNMNKGITILFHGYPGTGKTSTALQIAKETGRVLLSADAAQIKSMWIGESEKNTRKIFDEYRRISKQLKEQPILLFNEADAFLSKRVKVSHSTDQTFNSIQNILLQELENFEGIFIATTNLSNNLDHAFERRFLYKLSFEKPSNDTVCSLLSTAFPGIANDELREIANQFQLTGSNIQNIKKKIQIMQIFEETTLSAEQIKCLAEEEYLTSVQRNSIGFIKTKN